MWQCIILSYLRWEKSEVTIHVAMCIMTFVQGRALLVFWLNIVTATVERSKEQFLVLHHIPVVLLAVMSILTYCEWLSGGGTGSSGSTLSRNSLRTL